jgi:anti-anti-sigma regulatory factor
MERGRHRPHGDRIAALSRRAGIAAQGGARRDRRRVGPVVARRAIDAEILALCAILLGITLSVLAHLWRELGISVQDWVENDTILHFKPMGVLYFASAPRLEDAFIRVLSQHPLAALLVIHLDGLGRIDLSGALMMRAVVEDAEAAGLEVRFEDVPPHAVKIVERVLGSERISLGEMSS